MTKLIKSPNLEQLKSFNSVCILGSITRASKQTGIARATLGRHISALEEDLSSQLFKRTASRLILTDIGETTFKYSQTIFELTKELSEAVLLKNSALTGSIKIHASSGIASILLPNILTKLNKIHKGLQIEITPMNVVSMDADKDADIGIQTYRPTRKDLITSKLGDLKFGIYASKKYLQEKGEPHSLSDLQEHTLIGTIPEPLRPMLEELWGKGINDYENIIKCNDYPLIWRMVVEGCGIGMTHRMHGDKEPSVKPIFQELKTLTLPVWLVAQPDFKTRARVKKVFQFIAKEMRGMLKDC